MIKEKDVHNNKAIKHKRTLFHQIIVFVSMKYKKKTFRRNAMFLSYIELSTESDTRIIFAKKS